MARVTKVEQRESAEFLRSILKPGDTVYSSLVRVSRSGMNRKIRFHIARDGRITDITYHLHNAIAGGYSLDKDGNLSVSGCGMDMGFAVVYNLSSVLFPDGFTCTGRDRENCTYCPSNDHSNGDRDYEPHHHASGGYALRHSWL